MGRTYSVPRNVKGETRLLYIFTIKSFIFTVVFGVVGIVLSLPFFLTGVTVGGLIVTLIFALIGYLSATLTIPDTPIVGVLRKAGGEQLGDIIFRTLTFIKRKKIYVYREGAKKWVI